MVRVKICGITNLGDALASVKAGCDAIGFVFYKKSARYITPRQAGKIIRQSPARVIKIGIFVNAPEKTVKKIARICKLDILQFHGNESPQFCDRFKGYKIIKAFRIKDKIDLTRVIKYKTFAYLFDTFLVSRLGGTGKTFDWSLLGDLEKINRPVFLSGGLDARNIKQAIKLVHPSWVDASSSLEARPGKKDYLKVKRFIARAKGKG
jgi:phosphoribosylanthranilate isomerase